ncbi:MAG: HAMP domain-containing protein [Desulfamplus sp.]|nr:HAMP domain-containing protein [Desulfamplus sp.]
MSNTTSNSYSNDNPTSEKGRFKKELILIAAILITVSLLTFAEIKITGLSDAIPVSNAVLMFILININLLLLIALIFLVFRNLAKLYYEKKSKILGTKFKTKLVAAFITLSLLPTSVLFFFSIHFISTSLAFWFNAPVEQALQNALSVGRLLYSHLEDKNLYFAKQAVEHIDIENIVNTILDSSNKEKEEELQLYSEVMRKTFDLHAIEIYKNDGKRLILSIASNIDKDHLKDISEPISTDELMRVDRVTGARTFSNQTLTGEIMKTIVTIPSGSTAEDARAFLVVSVLISPKLWEHIVSISKGVDEYQQLTMIKKPVQISNYIALSIVALLVVFGAIWFGFHLAKSITVPIMKFAEGTQRVTQGDLNYTIDFEADDEIATLVDSFNSMTRELASGREKLAASKKMVEQQNEEIEKSRQYMEIVLRNISTGVISVDSSGIVTTINKAAENMLNIKASEILHKHYRENLQGELLQLAEKIYKEMPSSLSHIELPLTLPINGSPKYFLAHFTALKAEAVDKNQSDNNIENIEDVLASSSGDIIGVVMVFDDVTELEKAQRMVAWREVARRIAHEVKNPLTPIKLSAQRLKRKYSKSIQEEVFDQCIDTIVEHVDLIRNLVNEFSTFAKFPDTNTAPARIEAIIQETIALYKEGLENVEINFSYPPNLPELQLDRQQMKQAFINLFDNAVAALNKNGKINIETTYDEILKFVRVEMSDNGKGISDLEKTRLFEPYFSTKKSGMGLGLAIVNSIITDHKGMIRVQDNEPVGAKFIIELPA